MFIIFLLQKNIAHKKRDRERESAVVGKFNVPECCNRELSCKKWKNVKQNKKKRKLAPFQLFYQGKFLHIAATAT
jgi:hypothetical protein